MRSSTSSGARASSRPRIARTSACAPRGCRTRQSLRRSTACPCRRRTLIVRVAGTPDVSWFLDSGRLAAESIGETLERAGTGIEAMTSILDFGCGCGRVVRHWSRFDVRVSGSDLSGAAIDWCRENLPFARFETNGLSPPLAFAHDSFDLAYALSVLTHLPGGDPARMDGRAAARRPATTASSCSRPTASGTSNGSTRTSNGAFAQASSSCAGARYPGRTCARRSTLRPGCGNVCCRTVSRR